MSRNPEFLELLERMKVTHEKKSQDYSNNDNVFSNFEFAAQISEAFSDPIDRVFATLCGVKLARISELRKGKVPNNESLEDSFLDLANYCAIWGSRIMKDSKTLTPKMYTKVKVNCNNCGVLDFVQAPNGCCETCVGLLKYE